MPGLSSSVLELPEVEVIAERLRLTITGLRLISVHLERASAFRPTSDFPATRLFDLAGARVASVSRQGRNLLLGFDSGLYLGIGFGSDGRVEFTTTSQQNPDLLLSLKFENGSLLFREPLEIGRAIVMLGNNPRSLLNIAELGPDPLNPGFDLNRLRSLLRRRNRSLRRFLTDQSSLAGLGPATADEILFEARLSPLEPTATLQPEQTIRLHLAIKRVLQSLLLAYRSLPAAMLPDPGNRPPLNVHRLQDSPCRRCGTQIRTVREGRAIANYCPHCQTGGTILADRQR